MNTQMPQFGEANVARLVELLGQADSKLETKFATLKDKKKGREFGHLLAGNKGLNCVACHTFQYKISDTMPAVDLTEMTDRLQKEWFYEYMLNPQGFSPNTVMPSFWPNGKAMRKDLEGDPKDQIEAIWEYLLAGRQARMPAGVVRKPLEIVVKDTAQILRRKYPGIGKRGIGVGFPNKVNIAYDAEQLRLGLLWQGQFAEASGVWRGQGSGNVRPLGRSIEFAKGPDFDDSLKPWLVDDGRPPQHQFMGYRLDDKSRPTFLYRYGDIHVEESFVESGSDKLARKITLHSGGARSGLRFRIASGPELKKDGEHVLLAGKVRIAVEPKSSLNIVQADQGKEIYLNFDLEEDAPKKFTIHYSWLKDSN